MSVALLLQQKIRVRMILSKSSIKGINLYQRNVCIGSLPGAWILQPVLRSIPIGKEFLKIYNSERVLRTHVFSLDLSTWNTCHFTGFLLQAYPPSLSLLCSLHLSQQKRGIQSEEENFLFKIWQLLLCNSCEAFQVISQVRNSLVP